MDIVRIFSKFMNLHVAQMNENDRTFYGDLKIQKQLSQSTFIILGDTYWKLIANAGHVSENEVNFLPLPYKWSILLPPRTPTV